MKTLTNLFILFALSAAFYSYSSESSHLAAYAEELALLADIHKTNWKEEKKNKINIAFNQIETINKKHDPATTSCEFNIELSRIYCHYPEYLSRENAFLNVRTRCNQIILGISALYHPSCLSLKLQDYLKEAKRMLYLITIKGGYGIKKNLKKADDITNYRFNFNEMIKEIKQARKSKKLPDKIVTSTEALMLLKNNLAYDLDVRSIEYENALLTQAEQKIEHFLALPESSLPVQEIKAIEAKYNPYCCTLELNCLLAEIYCKHPRLLSEAHEKILQRCDAIEQAIKACGRSGEAHTMDACFALHSSSRIRKEIASLPQTEIPEE